MRRLVTLLTLLALGLAPLASRAQDWTPPTDEQIEKMTSSDYWGWVIACRVQGKPEGMDVLVKLTKRFKDDKYHEQVWTAIWTRMSEAETELQRENDPALRKKFEDAIEDLKFLAEAIEVSFGDKSYTERVVEQMKLDPQTRQQKAWAIGRYEAARTALEVEKDFVSALARADAGFPVIEKIGDKHWMHKFLSLMAECYVGMGKTPDAAAALRRAADLAKENNEPDFVTEYEGKLKAMEASGVAMKRSALDLEDSWDTTTGDHGWKSYPMAPGGGKNARGLPFRFPNPTMRDNTFFWRRVYLEDGRKGNAGGVPGAEKIGIPGNVWLMKEPGKAEAKVSEDPSKGGDKFKVGPNPDTQRFKAIYPNPTAGRPAIPLDYWFEVCSPTNILIWNQKTTVVNPPNLLDLKVRGMTWRTGRGPEGPFTIVDGNFNGQFGVVWEAPFDDQKDLGNDGLLCGGGKKGIPFSPLVKCGRNWYLMQPQKSSLACEFRKFAPPEGETRLGQVSVRLDGLKGKPYWVILSMPFTFKKGTSEVNATAYVDVSDAVGKPMDIPTGSWSLHYALISTGNDEKANRVEVKPGTYAALDVEEGKVAEVVLGGTLTPVVDALYSDGSGEVTVKTDSFRVYGERGEIYHSIWPDVLEYGYEVMDEKGPIGMKGTARKYTEREQKPAHDALAFAKAQVDKPKRKPQGNLWVQFSATDKVLGKLTCAKPPVIPVAKSPAEAPAAPAGDEKPDGEKKD